MLNGVYVIVALLQTFYLLRVRARIYLGILNERIYNMLNFI